MSAASSEDVVEAPVEQTGSSDGDGDNNDDNDHDDEEAGVSDSSKIQIDNALRSVPKATPGKARAITTSTKATAGNTKGLRKLNVKMYGYPPLLQDKCDSCKVSSARGDEVDCFGWLSWVCEGCNDLKVKCSHTWEDLKVQTMALLKASNVHGGDTNPKVALGLKKKIPATQAGKSGNLSREKGKGKMMKSHGKWNPNSLLFTHH